MVNNKKTIKEIADIWKEDKRQYVKQSTMAVYLLSLENHLLPIFGGKMEVTEEEVQAFALDKLNHGLSQKKYQGHAHCFKNGGSFRREARLAQSCRVES